MSISKRAACTRRAMELWQIHGEKYSTNISRYQDLLQKKQTMGIEPLRKIQKSILQEYPKVPFLMLTSKIEAEAYLKQGVIVVCLVGGAVYPAFNGFFGCKCFLEDAFYMLIRI